MDLSDLSLSWKVAGGNQPLAIWDLGTVIVPDEWLLFRKYNSADTVL